MQPEATASGTSQESDLHDWQLRARWELKSMDEIPDDAEEELLPAAEIFSEVQRTCVMLPSGNVLEVDGAVLLHSCHALRPHASELLEKVLWLTYLPTANSWDDDPVSTFFGRLHEERLEKHDFDNFGMYPCYVALIDALGVEAAKATYTHIAKCAIKGTINSTPTGRIIFQWLDGFQRFNDSWKSDALSLLSQLSPEKLKLWWDGDNRRRLLEAFTTQDLVMLAFSRWTGKYQPLPASASSTPQKRSRLLGDVVLDQAKHLLPSMQLKIVISDDFSVTCTRDLVQIKAVFIREAPVDEDEPIPTIHLPFASPFPQDEVLEFFTMVDDGATFSTDCNWKFSWVQLADYLQMSDVLDHAATWLWSMKHIARIIEWLPVTKLHSMQQRRPVTMMNTLHAENVLTLLATAAQAGTKDNMAAAALQRYGVELVEHLGVDAFLEILHIKPKST